jgi:hypothetical protein
MYVYNIYTCVCNVHVHVSFMYSCLCFFGMGGLGGCRERHTHVYTHTNTHTHTHSAHILKLVLYSDVDRRCIRALTLQDFGQEPVVVFPLPNTTIFVLDKVPITIGVRVALGWPLLSPKIAQISINVLLELDVVGANNKHVCV